MPSDIYIKTSSGGWSSAAKAIQIKVSSTLWKAAKAVFLNFDVSGWTKVWPVSGPFATNFPFIVSTASGSTHLTSANVRRVGTSLYGRFNLTDWNSNGWGTLSYTYTWKYYTVSASGDATGETQISTGAYVSPSQILVLGTGQDQKYLSFKIRGTSASNPIYFGESESGDSEDGRIYIAKNKPELLATGYPEIQVGSKGTSLTAIPNVGDVLTYSNTWDTASDKSITSSRTVTRWYRKTTFPSLVSDARSAGGGYLDTTGLSSIGTGLTYTVTNLDIGNYIYCNQEVFNSGSDYDFAGWKYDQATQVPPQEGFGRKVGEACYNRVLGAVPVGTAGTVAYTRDPASYTYTISNNGTWTNTPTSYRYQWYLQTQTSGSNYTYSPITGATSSTYNASVYAPSGATSYFIVPVVWAINANGESVSGFGLQNSGGVNIPSTAGGISGTPLRVFYREPSITTFTVTGGVNKFTYVSDYSVSDPAYTAVISWTGTGTGSLNVTSSVATQTSGFLAAGTYNFTLTVTNAGSFGNSYNKVLTQSNKTITAAAPVKAAGTKKIIPLGITVTSASTIAYVSTNGYIGLNSDPGTSVSVPTTGRYLSILQADLRQTALYTTSTNTTYSIRYQGAIYNDPTQTVDYEIRFTFGSTAAHAYIITNNLTNGTTDTVLFVDNVLNNTWSTLNDSTMTASATIRNTLQDGIDDARTAITLTAAASNLTTNPAYGAATSAATGWSASITTAASPSGGVYSVVSATTGSASVNSSTGALTVSGLTASQSSTVTVRYSLSGYNAVDITKTGSASAAVAAPTNSSPPTLSVSPSLNVGGTFTFTAGTWTGSPTSYALYLYRGTAAVATSETLVAGPLNAQSGTYVIPLSDFNDANNRKYYRAFASATNAGGPSSIIPGQELGPITNTVTLKRPNVPTGLTTPSSGTSPNLVFNSSSWTAPVVDATHNAATHYQVYFEASTSQFGTYVAAANTFTYTNNQFGSTVATNANTPLTAKAVYSTSVSTGKVTASTGSYTWVKMWVRAANGDGYSDWVNETG